MQFIVENFGYILQSLLGTTMCESVTAAANVFLGMCEAPLLIRPYIKVMFQQYFHIGHQFIISDIIN